MRVYTEFAEWWPLFSPAEHYVEEVEDFPRLSPLPASRINTLLELGSGGGSFAFHLKDHFRLTLTDLSEGIRGFRYLEWHWDPDPDDTTYLVDYAFMMRERNGEVRVLHDRHVEGLFPRQTWLDAFRSAGLAASSDLDAFGRDVFMARPRTDP